MSTDTLLKRTRVRKLVAELNRHRHLYYNENTPEISDAVYDSMVDELAALERETGLILSSSPTQSVGAPIVSSLAIVQHNIPLLSLDKTKTPVEVIEFIGNRVALFMLKLDGLTTKLEYSDGELIRASTRGDGSEGEDITHNARVFMDVPLKIPHKGYLCISGESYISNDDFIYLQANTVGKDNKPYKNARNLAAGSVRQLDARECSKRRIRFSAFNVLDGKSLEGVEYNDNSSETPAMIPVDTNSKSSMLSYLNQIGFNVAHFHKIDGDNNNAIPHAIESLQVYAKKHGIPIDGLVATYDDVEYSKSLGRTGHHYRDGLAFKFEDGAIETILTNVEWNVSRSGELTPVAIFETVKLDGTDVSRASLHNLNFLQELNLKIRDRIMVSKRNLIIPHVEENLDIDKPPAFDAQALIPSTCPCCDNPLNTVLNNDGDPSLFCDNPMCFDRKLRQYEHFACKKAMNINGLSTAALAKFMIAGLLNNKVDIYSLCNHKATIVSMDGYGAKAFSKLIEAIEKSRTTTMERFLIAMDIPMVGRHASAILCQAFNYDLSAIKVAALGNYDFTVLQDFGDILHDNIRSWFQSECNLIQWEEIINLMDFKTASTRPAGASDNPFAGKTIVATGSFVHYTRDTINEQILTLGAKPGSSVSKKTDYLIVGDKAGSKKIKAEQLGVPTLTEEEFREMAGV